MNDRIRDWLEIERDLRIAMQVAERVVLDAALRWGAASLAEFPDVRTRLESAVDAYQAARVEYVTAYNQAHPDSPMPSARL
jgi:hypothetical protein